MEATSPAVNVTTRLVDLATVPYGQPLALVPSGVPVYAIHLRRVFGRFFNTIYLQFGGAQGVPLVGVGDRFHFTQPLTEGVQLVNVVPAFSVVPGTAPARNYLEFVFSHAPGLWFDSDATDPFAMAPLYSFDLESASVAPNFPFVELQNGFNPAVANRLLAWLQCQRLIVSSTVDQAVVVTSNFVTPASANMGQPHVVADVGGPPVGFPGMGNLVAGTAAAIAGGELARFRVRAGEAVPLPFLMDLPPSQTGAQANGMRVWGATTGTTIDVTYEWVEEWIK